MRSAILGLGLGLLLVAGTSRPAPAQERSVRFAILAVGDSTLSFNAGTARWVKRGLQGIAVDPVRRDTMVARFRVLTVSQGNVTALITGQVTAVSTDHLLLLDEPRPSFLRRHRFWVGVAVGGALGVAVARSP